MKSLKFTLSTLIIIAITVGCKKVIHCENCQTATLHYTPNCSSIKGYVTLDKTNETLVFQHDIDRKFRQSGIKVCINYDKEDNMPLTSDCIQGLIIKINCIEKK